MQIHSVGLKTYSIFLSSCVFFVQSNRVFLDVLQSMLQFWEETPPVVSKPSVLDNCPSCYLRQGLREMLESVRH